jgi:hypothetical protein
MLCATCFSANHLLHMSVSADALWPTNPQSQREDLTQSRLLDGLDALGLPGDVGLRALAGLASGLSLVERANRRFMSILLSHIGR